LYLFETDLTVIYLQCNFCHLGFWLVAYVQFARVISERKLFCASHMYVHMYVCTYVYFCVGYVKVNRAYRYRSFFFSTTPPKRRT